MSWKAPELYIGLSVVNLHVPMPDGLQRIEAPHPPMGGRAGAPAPLEFRGGRFEWTSDRCPLRAGAAFPQGQRFF